MRNSKATFARASVTSLPCGGIIVAKTDLQQLLSLWELQAELEGVTARLACPRMTPEALAATVEVHESSDARGMTDFIVNLPRETLAA